ncbi:MAG TPA: iron-sulfur cluster assembly scaffold protein [Steroidobacteraceae bacterium]|nr:iron-sulfur cluster assembly scaffold protein [Steroidobacteraceae bacterium]
MAEEPDDPLGPRVRALFSDLAHAGDLTAAGGIRVGEAGCVGLGTRVRFSLALNGTRVEQVRYRAYGCPFTLATCEWLARQLTGRQLAGISAQALRAAVGAPPDWAAALGIPLQRLGRLLVVEDALQQAAVGSSEGNADIAPQH